MNSDLIKRLREAFDGPSVAEKNIMLRKASDALEAQAKRIAELEVKVKAQWDETLNQRDRAEKAEARIAELEADYRGQGMALIDEVNKKLEAQTELAAARACLRAAPDPWKAPDQNCWRQWQLEYASDFAAARGDTKETDHD